MTFMPVPSAELVLLKLIQDNVNFPTVGYGGPSTVGFSTSRPKLTVGDSVGRVVNNWGDKTSWVKASPIGGSIVTGSNVYRGTVALDVFARPKVAGKNAPWGVASVTAQFIAEYSVDWATNVRVSVVAGQTSFRTVSVSSFGLLSLPLRIDNDPNGLAHLAMTASITYSAAPQPSSAPV